MSALAPATWPAEDPSLTRLLHVDPARGTYGDAQIAELERLLRPGRGC